MSKNLATTTIASHPGPPTSATSVTVATGTGSRLYAGMAVIHPANTTPTPANAEVISITDVTGDVLTIVRAQESSTARAIATGDVITQGITAAMWDTLVASNAGKAATSHVHSAADVTSGTLGLARGGTGGTDAATARTNLGLGTAAVESPATLAANAAFTATYGRRAQVLRTRIDPDAISDGNRVAASPPTVGAPTTATAIPSGVEVVAGATLAVQNPAVARHAFTWYAGNVTQLGTSFPDFAYMRARYVTDPLSGNGGAGAVEFMFDGTTLEIMTKGVTNTMWIAVDGEYVAATPISVPNSGARLFYPVTFADRRPRRIRVEFNLQTVFGGVMTAPGDTVVATQPSSPLVFVHGDSFSEGGGGGYSSRPWWRTFGNCLGWPNIWSTSLGSTGWLTVGPSSRPKFRDRLATDVYPYSPDVLVLAGGINDTAWTETQIRDEVTATLTDIRTNLPNCIPVVVAPFGKTDISAVDPWLGIWQGIKTAAATGGALYLDLLEMPAYGAQVATTLASAASSGATTISTVAAVPRGATIRIGATQRRRVANISGSGPFTVTVAALTATVASGEAVTEVGGSLWTSANLATLVGADTTHPTQAGSDLIGVTLAQQFARRLAAY